MKKKRILTEEHRRKIGDGHRGKKKTFSKEAIENIRRAAALRRGIPTGPPSEETKEKIRIATTGKSKTITSPNPSWYEKGAIPMAPFKKGHIPWNKGKKTPKEAIDKMIESRRAYVEMRRASGVGRRSWNSKQWANAIKKRDKYTCQDCFSTEDLAAHHIKSWNTHPDLRFELENGITLCRSCHARLHGKEKCNLKNVVLFKKGNVPWSKDRKFSLEHRRKSAKLIRVRLRGIEA